jgi:hypothetical protein
MAESNDNRSNSGKHKHQELEKRKKEKKRVRRNSKSSFQRQVDQRETAGELMVNMIWWCRSPSRREKLREGWGGVQGTWTCFMSNTAIISN